MIANRATEDEILLEARKFGLRSLAESGVQKVAEGLTSIEEVIRVVDIIDKDAQQEEKRGDKIKILVTDDDKLMRTMVIAAFKEERDTYEFVEAENGQHAVRLVYETKPDLLILDVMMPQKDGYEVVKYLRSRLETASLPIIMLTTRSDKESEISGLDLGADDYITKPFDRDRLRARVKMLLKRRA